MIKTSGVVRDVVQKPTEIPTCMLLSLLLHVNIKQLIERKKKCSFQTECSYSVLLKSKKTNHNTSFNVPYQSLSLKQKKQYFLSPTTNSRSSVYYLGFSNVTIERHYCSTKHPRLCCDLFASHSLRRGSGALCPKQETWLGVSLPAGSCLLVKRGVKINTHSLTNSDGSDDKYRH